MRCAGAGVHRVLVSYELRALVGRHPVVVSMSGRAAVSAVELPQGYGLLPITDDVYERLGGGDGKPFGDAVWFLSPAIEALGRRASHIGSVAYLEAEMFGGTGTQATVAWRSGKVCLGPVTTTFGWPPPELSTNSQWAFNHALRELGVARGDAIDEFDALGLGGNHRHTEDWLDAP